MENIKKSFKAIIFDMDGTIIKTGHIWDNLIPMLLAQHNIMQFTNAQQEYLSSMSGMGLINALQFIKDEFKLPESLAELGDQAQQHVATLFEKEVEFVEGFKEFHQRITQHNIPSGIATNADRASLTHLADKMQLHQFFGNNLYCVDDVQYRAKPDPALFLHTASQLGVKPEECIVFEDSIFGFNAARAAGMPCIAIRHSRNTEHLHHAHHAIDTYHEAEEALRKLIKK